MTAHESILRQIQHVRSQIEEVIRIAHATANLRDSLGLAKRLVGAALDAHFTAIAPAVKRVGTCVPTCTNPQRHWHQRSRAGGRRHTTVYHAVIEWGWARRRLESRTCGVGRRGSGSSGPRVPQS